MERNPEERSRRQRRAQQPGLQDDNAIPNCNATSQSLLCGRFTAPVSAKWSAQTRQHSRSSVLGRSFFLPQLRSPTQRRSAKEKLSPKLCTSCSTADSAYPCSFPAFCDCIWASWLLCCFCRPNSPQGILCLLPSASLQLLNLSQGPFSTLPGASLQQHRATSV